MHSDFTRYSLPTPSLIPEDSAFDADLRSSLVLSGTLLDFYSSPSPFLYDIHILPLAILDWHTVGNLYYAFTLHSIFSRLTFRPGTICHQEPHLPVHLCLLGTSPLDGDTRHQTCFPATTFSLSYYLISIPLRYQLPWRNTLPGILQPLYLAVIHNEKQQPKNETPT